LLADEEISIAGTGFELIQEKANEALWIWLARDAPIRDFILAEG
jgi:hypothetical protein